MCVLRIATVCVFVCVLHIATALNELVRPGTGARRARALD